MAQTSNITDKRQKKYHCKIFSFPVLSGLLSEAVEVIPELSERVSKRFTVLSDFDADLEQAELRLKIKKNLDQRHLTFENGKLEISQEEVLRGAINYTGGKDTSFNIHLEIDGKMITMEQFVEMLYTYEGFNSSSRYMTLQMI